MIAQAHLLSRGLLADRRGASAAEFALVLPLLILLLFGLIDAGRMLYDLNRAKKVAQYGVRIAAVVNPVEKAIAAENYIGDDFGSGVITQGDVVPASALGPITCQTSNANDPSSAIACTNTGLAFKDSAPTVDTAAFDLIVLRMKAIASDGNATNDTKVGYIKRNNVTVAYRGSGLGYAGNPYGAETSPLITVGLRGLTMQSVATLGILDLTLPAVESTLTAEDMSTHSFSSGTTGSQSN